MAIQDNLDRAKAFIDGPFAGLCSPAEFAEIFHIGESAVRHMILDGRLVVGRDCLKLGKQWVLCEQAFRTYEGNYMAYSNAKCDCYKAVQATERG